MGVAKEDQLEHGFLQVDNQILDLLLCDTQLNVYGILILAKIREYQRKKVQCYISNFTFAKMFKTSESMIKRQMNELSNLGLIESTVKLNDKSRGKTRTLKTPRSFSRTLNKILTTKDYLDIGFKGQNSTLHTDFDPRKEESFKGQNSDLGAILTLEDSQKTEDFKGQNQGSNVDFDPRTDDTFKGHFQGSKQDTFKGHSDPITIGVNNRLINNRFLEDETGDFQSSVCASSPTSSNDDSVASKDAPLKDALQDILIELSGAELDANNDTNNDTGDEFSMPRYGNQKNEEITAWFYTLNPISRYTYELKYKGAAKNFAWGEKDKPENQPDYYTPSQIIEYFTLEGKLDYLREIEWEHSWMI